MAIEKRREDRPEGRKSESKSDGMEMWENIGLDVDSMSPQAQVAIGAIVAGGVVAAVAVLLAFVPWLWWMVFVFGWTIFPAVGLFLKGIAGVLDSDDGKKTSAGGGERELLESLSRNGEMTPAQAAMDTTLTVREADEIMKKLASDGHLDVRVHGGGIFYALWDHDRS